MSTAAARVDPATEAIRAVEQMRDAMVRLIGSRNDFADRLRLAQRQNERLIARNEELMRQLADLRGPQRHPVRIP